MEKEFSFTFDDLEILGGFGDLVHVKGELGDYAIVQPVILAIEREMFKDMQDLWLDQKIDYCERFNHYCGVNGRIVCNSVDELYETSLYDYDNWDIDSNTPAPSYKVKVYKVNSFEDGYLNMEHG